MAGKRVITYTTPTCPWCRQLKEYLNQKGVQYTDYNVAVDRARFDEMMKLTGQAGVPVTVIDGKAKNDEALSR